jgi:hypothetical protein
MTIAQDLVGKVVAASTANLLRLAGKTLFLLVLSNNLR